MDSLFVRQAPKKGRVCLMLGASLLLHGGIVGIAALLPTPQPEDHTVVIDIWPNDGADLPAHPGVQPPIAPPETPEPTSSPEAFDKPVPTPPEPMETPEFSDTATPVPPRRVSSTKPAPAVHATSTQANSHLAPGQPASIVPGAPGAGSANAVGTWVTPHPPYPRVGLAIRATGATMVRITTDASGRVANVVIVKSAGNPVLDSQTESFVRLNWHGPPNADRTTEFVYQIR